MYLWLPNLNSKAKIKADIQVSFSGNLEEKNVKEYKSCMHNAEIKKFISTWNIKEIKTETHNIYPISHMRKKYINHFLWYSLRKNTKIQTERG